MVREAVRNGEFDVYHLSTNKRIANALTKNLGDVKFKYFIPRFMCK